MFNDEDYDFFYKQGYFIARGLVSKESMALIKQQAKLLIENPVEPFELEAALKYKGAPVSVDDEGGETIRRFLQMHQRDKIYTQWLKENNIAAWIKKLLSTESARLVKAHHNSLMTKQPKYSSATNWHRDVRYWNYPEQNLVSAWLAFGREHSENGGLKIIPETHNKHFDKSCYDEKKFFRDDLPENQDEISNAINVDINEGDVLFFHARLLHAANANRLGEAKISLVYTFRDAKNKPKADTRSDQQDIEI